MSNAPEGFVTLKSQAKGRWYPNKQGDSKETLTSIESSDKTFLQGYYVGSEEIEVNGKKGTLHTLKFVKAGNPKSILSDDPLKELDDVSFFGSMVVNEQLSKVIQGQMVYIRWDGKVNSKKAGGSPYNMWTVAVNPNVEILDVNTNTVVDPETKAVAKAPVQNNSTEGLTSDDDSDDLPF